MRRDQVIASLKRSLKGDNAGWFAVRGIAHLPPGVDPVLVRRAMAMALDVGWSLVPDCRTLPDEYAPLLRSVLKTRSPGDRIFLETWLRSDQAPGPQVREAAEWLHQLRMVDDHPTGRARLARLAANPRGLEATQAVVAAGIEEGRMLAVLAHDGSEGSVDILTPLVLRALEKRDESLDLLRGWLEPFAKGPLLARALEELDAAADVREHAAPLKGLLQRFGVKGPHLHLDVVVSSREVSEGFTRLASAWIVIQSRQLPHVKVSVALSRSSSPDHFLVEDGKVHPNGSLPLEAPRDLEALPAWLAGAARTLGVHWEAAPQRVTSSLRGASRQRAVDWLLSG